MFYIYFKCLISYFRITIDLLLKRMSMLEALFKCSWYYLSKSNKRNHNFIKNDYCFPMEINSTAISYSNSLHFFIPSEMCVCVCNQITFGWQFSFIYLWDLLYRQPHIQSFHAAAFLDMIKFIDIPSTRALLNNVVIKESALMRES